MDKLHLWTVWLLVSAEGCLDPCQGKLKDGSQLDHANNQLAPGSSPEPWAWQSPKTPSSLGPYQWETKRMGGKGSGNFKGDMDLV